MGSLTMLVYLLLMFFLKGRFYNVYKPASKRDIQIDLARIDWCIILSIGGLDFKVESYQKLVQDIYDKHCPMKRFRA